MKIMKTGATALAIALSLFASSATYAQEIRRGEGIEDQVLQLQTPWRKYIKRALNAINNGNCGTAIKALNRILNAADVSGGIKHRIRNAVSTMVNENCSPGARERAAHELRLALEENPGE